MMALPSSRWGERGPRHVEIAVDVGLEGAVQLLLGDVFQRIRVFLKRGVVYQDIQPAQLPGGLLYGAPAKLGIGHIARNQDSPAALRFHRTQSLLGILMLIQVDDGDIGSGGSG
jgi:hypothetical protein